jgi:hypothetical protein
MGIYICLLDGESQYFLSNCSVYSEQGKLIYQIDLIYIPISLLYINIDWSHTPSLCPMIRMSIYLSQKANRNG